MQRSGLTNPIVNTVSLLQIDDKSLKNGKSTAIASLDDRYNVLNGDVTY
jgi:hypothetical protein